MAAPTNLHRDLGRIEGKLDAVLSEIRKDIRSAHSRLDGHDSRLEVIENREEQRLGAVKAARWAWGAATAALGFLGGAFGGGYIR